jgi:hypothetical protein
MTALQTAENLALFEGYGLHSLRENSPFVSSLRDSIC